jgi:uncharacterized membrane protein
MSVLSLPSFRPEHVHPILVNFTASLLPASFISDVFGRISRRQSLHTAAWWMLLYATAITPLTIFAGLWWKASLGAGLPPSVIRIHQLLGISLGLLFIVLAVWRGRTYSRATAPGFPYLLLAMIVAAALIYQGSMGGELAFGP